MALYCTTKNINETTWMFPNSSEVMMKESRQYFINKTKTSVILNRRTAIHSGVYGIFTCSISDNNQFHNIYVGIYPPNEGMNVIHFLQLSVLINIIPTHLHLPIIPAK